MSFLSKVFKPNVRDLIERKDAYGIINALCTEKLDYPMAIAALETLAKIGDSQCVQALRECARAWLWYPPSINGKLVKSF